MNCKKVKLLRRLLKYHPTLDRKYENFSKRSSVRLAFNDLRAIYQRAKKA